MEHILLDIWEVIKSMSLIDFILYFSVVILMILIVSLIYVIYTEKLEEKQEEKHDEIIEPTKEGIDIIEQKEESFDLASVINEINENPKPIVDMTSYEEEQEQRAIISYDELLATSKKEIQYEKEELIDDIIPVKKLSLNKMELPKEITYIEKEPKIEVDRVEIEEKEESLFSYAKEEAFLKSLQQLSELLNQSNL